MKNVYMFKFLLYVKMVYDSSARYYEKKENYKRKYVKDEEKKRYVRGVTHLT